jgi:MEMO1 family protein
VLKKPGNDAIIVASSDMTHYEPHEKAKEKDKKAIEAILDLDTRELVKRIELYNITMCGYAPAISLMTAAKDLGARKTELVKYMTSGDTSGDFSSVVGYAGIIISR